MLGGIKWAPKYKYLRVKVTTSSVSGSFVEATKTCKQKLRSHAGIILGITKNDFDPIKNGLILWNEMAVVAALYGTKVIHFKRQDINELESIQGNFLAHLLWQITLVSHIAVRKEAGVKPIEQIMMDMKLNYWYHLTRSTEDSWLRAAFAENFKTSQGPRNK